MKDLGLVLKPTEGLGVNDAVAVALEVGAQGLGSSSTLRPRESRDLTAKGERNSSRSSR